MTDLAPLDDPAYDPVHKPVDGRIPDVVAKWAPASQLRWFSRFGGELGVQPHAVWDRYYALSPHHRGLCCRSCYDELEYGTGVMQDGWCCCKDERTK